MNSFPLDCYSRPILIDNIWKFEIFKEAAVSARETDWVPENELLSPIETLAATISESLDIQFSIQKLSCWQNSIKFLNKEEYIEDLFSLEVSVPLQYRDCLWSLNCPHCGFQYIEGPKVLV